MLDGLMSAPVARKSILLISPRQSDGTKCAACGEIIYELLMDMGAEMDKEIAWRIYIAVTTDTGYSSTIANGLTVGDENNFIGVLGIDAQSNTQYFTVTVTFDDKGYTFEDGVLSSENDAAQTKDVNFDLVVYAVQVTTAP